MMITNLLLIAFICVAITDIAGFQEEMKQLVWKWTFNGKKEYKPFSLKPLDCSLCLTFWTGLIYIAVTGAFTLQNIALTLLVSVLTPVIKDLIILTKDICIKIIGTIYCWLSL